MNNENNVHAGHRARMIDKILKSNGKLPEHELLEVMLFSVIPRRNTNDIAHNLIRTFGSIRNVFNAEPEKLKMVDGVGDKVVAHIILLSKIFSAVTDTPNQKVFVKSFFDIKNLVLNYFAGDKDEKFLVILLDKRYQMLTTAEFADRKDMKVEIDVHELAKLFGMFSPRFVILAHNHPSGRIEPSEQDDLTTYNINTICDIHGTSLVDHVIVGGEEVYSYYQERRLDKIKEIADKNKIIIPKQGE